MHLEIMLFALFFSVVSIIIQYRFGQRKEIKKMQSDMKEKQKDFNEKFKKAQETKDEKLMKELEENEKEMMGSMTKMMTAPFKAMIIILPLFLIAAMGIAFFYPHSYDDAVLEFKLSPNDCTSEKGLISACHQIPADAVPGEWNYTYSLLKDGKPVSTASGCFNVGSGACAKSGDSALKVGGASPGAKVYFSIPEAELQKATANGAKLKMDMGTKTAETDTKLPIALPVPSLDPFPVVFRDTFGPKGLFILWVILFGLVLETLASMYHDRVAKGKKGVELLDNLLG